ncbi:DUF1653 domain-containing protein [Burkholderia ubonensis]|uniref:DUF1653 domain-containing protein n=1 Tax=Burkholderia ubonensis TaxID=101571 RepID=UPI0007C774AE|nr:DUF1653 domain-containing protein [Burkholderia ubonensis]
MQTLPRPTSQWQHSNGNLYTVLCIANEFTDQPDRYPPTVVYIGLNGRIWSRPASDWHRSMTLVRDADDAPACAAEQDSQYDMSRPVSASNLPASMKIPPAVAGTFLSRWRDVIAQMQLTRGEGGPVAGAPEGERE